MTVVLLEPEVLQATLPTPSKLRKEIPLTDSHANFILNARESIEAILNGWDSKRLLIVGPCSIHDHKAARDYALRFKKLSEQVGDHFFMVMRTYFEKPRTNIGWKGLIYDPDLDGSHNLAKGVRLTRQLLADLAEMGIPTGCELLEINTSHYYSDFISWGCVGARTSASPPHRQLAATLPLPIGFKNSTDGNIDHPINGVLSANTPHVYLGMSPCGQMHRVQADGNSLCHIVLRGSISGPNYVKNSIQETVQRCRQAKIRDKLVIDCSHDNSGREPLQQVPVFESLVQQLVEGNDHIVGMMLESNLKGGNQAISSTLEYGVSITDPCLDWETTEKLILKSAEVLQSHRFLMK